MVKIGAYNYPNKVMENVFIDKQVRDAISKICKEKKLNKSKLVEEFYKVICIRFKNGSINSTNGYVTINILRIPILIPKYHKHKIIQFL